MQRYIDPKAKWHWLWNEETNMWFWIIWNLAAASEAPASSSGQCGERQPLPHLFLPRPLEMRSPLPSREVRARPRRYLY